MEAVEYNIGQHIVGIILGVVNPVMISYLYST